MPNVHFNERMQSMNLAYPYCLAAIQKFCDTGEGLKELAGHKGVFRLRANDGNHTRLILLPKEENGERVWVWHMTLPNHKYEKLEQKPASWWRNLQAAPLSAFATFTDHRSPQEGLHVAEPASSTPIPQVAESSTPQQFDFNTTSPSLVLYNDEWISLSLAQIELCENMKFPAVVNGVPGAGKSCIAFASLVRQVERLPAELSEKRFLYVTQSTELVREMQRNWNELLELGLLNLPQGCTVEFKTAQEVATEQIDNGLAFFAQPEASIKASVLTHLEKALKPYHQDPNNKKNNPLKQSLEELYQEIRAMSGYGSLQEYETAVGQHTLFPNPVHREWLWKQKLALPASLPTTQAFTPPYDFIAVDETQDLWRLEIKLLSNLAKREQILYSVGDHQSLYDSEFVVPFVKSLHHQNPHFHHKQLLEVYRCPQGVCDGANVVLELENKITGYTRYQVQKIHPRKETKAAPGETFWLGEDKQLQEQLKKIHGLFAVVMPQAFNEEKEKQAALQKNFKDKGKNVLTLEQFRVLQAEPESEEKTKKINEIDGLAFTPAEIKGLGFKNVFIYEPLSHDPRFAQANTVLLSQDPNKRAQVNPVELNSINPLALRPAFDELFISITRSSGNVFIVQPEDRNVRLLSQHWAEGIKVTKEKHIHAAQENLLQDTEEEKSEKLAKIATSLAKQAAIKVQEEELAKATAKKAVAEQTQVVASHTPKSKSAVASSSSSSAPITESSQAPSKKTATPPAAKKAVPASTSKATPPESPQNKLFKAIKNDKLKTVEQLLKDDPKLLNSNNEKGLLPLHMAAQEGKLEIVKFLISKKNIDWTGEDGAALLYYAAKSDALNIVKYILGKGVAIDCKYGDKQMTPLMHAALSGSEKTVKYLITQKASIYIKTSDDKTVIKLDSREGLHVIGYLEIITNSIESCTQAIQKNNLDPIKITLKEYPELLDYPNENGSTFLHIAAENGQCGIVEYLVSKGANIFCKNSTGKTALDLAREKNHLEIVKCLESILPTSSSNSSATNRSAFHTPLVPTLTENSSAPSTHPSLPSLDRQ